MDGFSDELEFLVDSTNVDNVGDASEIDYDLDELDDIEDDDRDVVEYEFSNSNGQDITGAALSRDKPLLLVHRSHQHASILPQVLNDAADRHSDELTLGAVVSMPRMSPKSIKSFFNIIPSDDVPIRIADPECFARMDSFGEELKKQRDKEFVGPSTSKYWTYFTEELPAGFTQEWIGAVLDAQRDCGATVLLSPGLWVDPASPAKSLAAMRQHAVWSRERVLSGEHLAVNVTLPSSWLANDVLREQLLNEIVDMSDPVFYMRFRWPLLAQPYGHLIDSSILEGYMELSATCRDNDIKLILPNTGLTGWLALAWGAHGFSTGMGSGERAFADIRLIKIKATGPRPAPTQRMFSSPLLHIVEKPILDSLDRLPNAQRCSCKFCIAMRRGGDGFDKPLAGAHYLRRVADLTAQISSAERGRGVAAREIVTNACVYKDESNKRVPLANHNNPRHLPLWRALL
ncbi:hypothetical protein [Actinophytocola sp.]|uniref:hypothetical protein n=1 Tax=Actinophytocola sp. TaxID=1872138 RepID=UPI00389A4C5F